MPMSNQFHTDAELSVKMVPVANVILFARGSRWQYNRRAPNGTTWTTASNVTWPTAQAPFGWTTTPGVRFSTPLYFGAPYYYFTSTFSVSAAQYAASLIVIVAVAADLGADIWINGQLIDNQAAVGNDDGGFMYWNRWLTMPTGCLVVGTNVVAARLNNVPQPSDGLGFDAEIGYMVAGGSTVAPTVVIATNPLASASQTSTASTVAGSTTTAATIIAPSFPTPFLIPYTAPASVPGRTTTSTIAAVSTGVNNVSGSGAGNSAGVAAVILAILLIIALLVIGYMAYLLRSRAARRPDIPMSGQHGDIDI